MKQFQEADAHIKKRQKQDFDRRHRARNLPPLQPETHATIHSQTREYLLQQLRRVRTS